MDLAPPVIKMSSWLSVVKECFSRPRAGMSPTITFSATACNLSTPYSVARRERVGCLPVTSKTKVKKKKKIRKILYNDISWPAYSWDHLGTNASLRNSLRRITHNPAKDWDIINERVYVRRQMWVTPTLSQWKVKEKKDPEVSD